MTASAKIEPRLGAEIERVRATDPNQPIPVILQLRSREDADAPRDFGEMERWVAGQQQDLLARLAELGVTETQSSVLSNSVKTRLTADQILDLARRSDIQRIVWNHEDFVAV